MKVHHLNCATLCPPLAPYLINDEGRLVCHCLLIETDQGLVLVDTGLGLGDREHPVRELGIAAMLLGPRLFADEAAAHQVARLGFQRHDVRHIVVTHLDFDHAGALPDFPDAQVHVLDLEYQAAMRPTLRERFRYHASKWAHGARWVPHTPRGERWFGFDCVSGLAGLPPEILLVPLLGHTRGHCGVAVKTPSGWLLHCGDAYFHANEIAYEDPRGTPGVKFVQRVIDDVDTRARVHNQARLRELAHAQKAEVRVFCAHDPSEFRRLRRVA
jgi:glyoxylase-like metal-dependent hydrolase (beta-lactamase superfamily II)